MREATFVNARARSTNDATLSYRCKLLGPPFGTFVPISTPWGGSNPNTARSRTRRSGNSHTSGHVRPQSLRNRVWRYENEAPDRDGTPEIIKEPPKLSKSTPRENPKRCQNVIFKKNEILSTHPSHMRRTRCKLHRWLHRLGRPFAALVCTPMNLYKPRAHARPERECRPTVPINTTWDLPNPGAHLMWLALSACSAVCRYIALIAPRPNTPSNDTGALKSQRHW